MSCGDPMCQCGCGSYLGQCRRARERSSPAFAPPLTVAAELGTLATVKRRLREYLEDIHVYREAMATLHEAERGGAAGVRGFMGPGLEKLHEKILRHEAWFRSCAHGIHDT